jgi:hypothetical protein
LVFVGIRSAKVIAKAFRAGFVRREALLFEWRWKTCTCGLSQQPAEAGGSLSREVPVRVGAAPTKPGCVSTARWRGPGEQGSRGVREELML